jgi:transcriptional regulator with GAF, ATPase, and Fis domain
MDSQNPAGFDLHGAMESVFARISAAAAPFLPHEEALLAWFAPDGSHLEGVLGREGHRQPAAELEAWLLDRPELARVCNRGPFGRGPVSCVRAPLRNGNGVLALVVFVGLPGAEYGSDDLQHAQWVADLIPALTGDAGRDSDTADPSEEEMLRELGDVLDVREVFPRISAIVNRLLPHDRLTMTFHDPDGTVGLQVTSIPGPPLFAPVKVDPAVLARPFVLFPELTPEGLADYGPPSAKGALLGSGYLSFLAVNVRARQQRMGVEFWSHRLRAFDVSHVWQARRIANYLALAVAHEQLVKASHEAEEKSLRGRRFEARVKTFIEELESNGGGRPIAGRSGPWLRVLESAARVADTDATVLLIGESGTGKEIIARSIHAASARSHGPFIAVNCAALPEELLESELFGYERGAFTGAVHPKPGQIELAAGGVLFLDEVSEMKPSSQAKFLRVLQEREFRRLGGTRLLKANVRVIAATNADLTRAVQSGEFRRDLYYRLRVFDLRMPSLRERLEDIPELAVALLDEIAGQLRRPRAALGPGTLAELSRHDWPGNVRELRNVLERAAIVCEGNRIEPGDLSFDGSPVELTGTTDIGTVERDLIEKVLRECHGNKSLAAKRLGLSRMQLYVRLRRYEVGGEA